MSESSSLQNKGKELLSGINLEKVRNLSLLVIGGVIFVYFAYQLGVGYLYKRSVSNSSFAVTKTVDKLTDQLDEWRQATVMLKDSQNVLVAIESAPSKIAAESQIETQIQNQSGTAADVSIFPLDIEFLEPEPYPGADYSTIALLLEAKVRKDLSSMGVVHLNTANEGIAWATLIQNQSTATDVAIMVVSFPFSTIREILSKNISDSIYTDLRMAQKYRKGVIYFQGELGGAMQEDINSTEITEHNIAIGHYVPATALWNQSSWYLNLIGFLIGVGLAYGGQRLEHVDDVEEETLQDLMDADPGKREYTGDEELEEAFDFVESGKPASNLGEVGVGNQMMSPTIFRAYDIRGVIGKTLTVQGAVLIGQAVGSAAVEQGVTEMVVARDGRLSSPEFSSKLIEGLVSTGTNVIDVGAVTTGMMYFATHHLKTMSGVMVTGSHNPADYNGFKIVIDGEPVAGEKITELHERIKSGNFTSGTGGVQEVDITEEYIDEIASDVLVEDQLKVVIDCGNGIGGMVAPRLLEEIGCEVEPLYCEVDGEFPNHHPDPSDPENLRDLILSVKNTGADLGLAMDGDADRLGVVTRDGAMIFADRILMLFAEDVLSRNPGAPIIYDVKCTGDLAKVILQHGGSPVMWKTGHSFIKQKMKEINAELAGEMSGHFFFKERWYGFDDGVYAAARLVEILAAHPDGIDDALGNLPDSVSTPEIKVEMKEGEHYAFMEQFKEKAEFDGARITTIDGIRADFEDGWGLVRCSNTTPCLVLRFDAESQEALDRISASFREQLLSVNKRLELPF